MVRLLFILVVAGAVAAVCAHFAQDHAVADVSPAITGGAAGGVAGGLAASLFPRKRRG